MLCQRANEKVQADYDQTGDAQFGDDICKLIAVGELQHIAQIIRNCKYYKNQDALMEGIVAKIQDFALHLNTLMFRHDYNYDQFQKALVDTQSLM